MNIGKSRNNVLFRLLVLVLLGGMLFFNSYLFDTNYAYRSKMVPDSILIYLVDRNFSELNREYAEAEGISIDRSDYYKSIKYDDVKNIASNVEGVENIYILNEKKINRFGQKREKSIEVSIPDVIPISYLKTMGIDSIFHLSKGRPPRDGVNEIVLSRAELQKYFPRIAASEVIGREIKFNKKNYRVTGISSRDIIWTSYNRENSVFYKYEEKSYDEYVKQELDFKTKEDYLYKNDVDDIVICTNNGQEKSVLNTLMKQYPADNYYSSAFDSGWSQKHNKSFIWITGISNIIITALLIALLCMILNHIVKLDQEGIKDLSYFYVSRENIKRKYLKCNASITIGLVIIVDMVWILTTGFEPLSRISFGVGISAFLAFGMISYMRYMINRIDIC